MTLSEKAAIVLEAVEQGFIHEDGIIRWAESASAAVEKPEPWLIKLALLTSSNITDYTRILRGQSAESVPLHWRVQMVALAHQSGLLNLHDCLPKLFNILIFDPKEAQEDSLDKQLHSALVEWEGQGGLEVIEISLANNFERLFREYLADAGEVTAIARAAGIISTAGTLGAANKP